MKKIIFSAAIFLSFIMAATAQENTAESKEILSYENYIKSVKEKLPELTQRAMSLKNASLGVDSAKGAFSPVITGGSKYYSNSGLSSMSSDTSGVVSYAALSKTFAETGTTVTGGFEYDYQTQSNAMGETKYHNPQGYVTVKQPLLKNFFGMINKNTISSSEITYNIEKESTEQYYTEIEIYYQKLYCKWVLYNQLEGYYKSYVNNANVLYAQTLRKKKAGLVENDDVQRVYSSVLSYKQQYSSIKNTLYAIETEIKYVTQKENISPDKTHLDSLYSTAFNYNYVIVNFENTSSYRIMKMNLEKLNINFKIAENSALPELNALASATVKDSSESQSEALELSKNDYYVGFEMSYSFGNSSNTANVKIAENNLKEYEASIKSTMRDYEVSLKNILYNISIMKQMIQYKESNLKALQSQLITEKKKYSQARITVSTVVDTENKIASEKASLLETKNNLISLYYDYIKLTK